MLKIIGNETIGIFCRRDLLREAAETADNSDLLAAWSQRPLKTGLRDFASGKCMISNDGRPFRHHEREVRVYDRLAVERAILAGIGLAHAKQSSPPTKKGRPFLSLPLFAE